MENTGKGKVTLTYRQAIVLVLRFGLLGGQHRTLDEVGVILGVTRERIRQIQGQALCQVRQDLGQEIDRWVRESALSQKTADEIRSAMFAAGIDKLA